MISVVIPNYNGNKYLRQCLDSVYSQQDIEFELIIIDNASTDGSYEWLKVYKEVQWTRLDQNYGFSRAVNEGIQKAKGEYVLLLNNDTVLYEGFLKAMLEAIEQDQRIFAVSSKMLRYDDPLLIDDAGDGYSLMGWAYKRGDGKPKEKYDQFKRTFSACAGAALYRKSVFEEIGYFDEHFFAYMEDVDISYRANIYGYYNVYAPKAEVLHIGSATSGSRYNVFKVGLVARNNVYVAYKNMPLIQLLFNSPFILIGYSVKSLFFMKKGLGKVYIKSLKEGFKTLSKVQKVPFRWQHLGNYWRIQRMLIKGTFEMLRERLQ